MPYVRVGLRPRRQSGRGIRTQAIRQAVARSAPSKYWWRFVTPNPFVYGPLPCEFAASRFRLVTLQENGVRQSRLEIFGRRTKLFGTNLLQNSDTVDSSRPQSRTIKLQYSDFDEIGDPTIAFVQPRSLELTKASNNKKQAYINLIFALKGQQTEQNKNVQFGFRQGR